MEDVKELYDLGKKKLEKYLKDYTPSPHSGANITLWKPHKTMGHYLPIYPRNIIEE